MLEPCTVTEVAPVLARFVRCMALVPGTLYEKASVTESL